MKRCLLLRVFSLLLFLCPITAYTCSLGLEPILGFDKNERIFTGTVIGLAGPIKTEKVKGEIWGLKIRIDEIVYVPESDYKSVEVFEIETWADCSNKGAERERTENNFPVGTKVKVVAQLPKLLPSAITTDVLRLEILPGSLGSISGNVYADGTLMCRRQGLFDYKAYKRTPLGAYDRRVIPDFELRKDLLRLSQSHAKSERVTILKRLVYFYGDGGYINYEVIAKKYLSDKSLLNRLVKARYRWVNS